VEKRLIYPQYNIRGDRDVFNVTEDRRWLSKTASNYHPEIQEYIKNAKPLPDLIQVLLTALGAHEYWGQNKNGDRFYESALKHPGEDFGYKTFLTNANYFTHHSNKDPSLAKGKVLATVWNDAAKRVELVVGINPTQDPDAASMLDNGEALCFSMGAKLPFDVCAVCQNKAKTRAEYCDHLRYQMNQIDPGSGLLVGAINPTPKFFDISRVLIPADKTAYMWEKIAHAGSSPLTSIGSAQLAQMTIKEALEYKPDLRKTAAVQKKTAEIRKRILAVSHPGAVAKLKEALTQVKQALDSSSPEIPMEVFRGPNLTLNQCLGSMALLGLVPTRHEINGLVSLFTGKNSNGLPAQMLANEINPSLIERLSPYVEGRSFLRPVLLRRVVRIEILPRSVEKVAGVTETGSKIVKGVFTALGSLFGFDGAREASKVPSGLSKIIYEHPVLAGVLAAIVMRRIKNPPTIVTDGNFTVADPTRGFYNNDWQRRFVEMQNRPVAVIKTGASHENLIPKVAADLFSPLTFLISTVDLAKTADEQYMWESVADQFLTNLKSSELQDLVKSASRVCGSDFSELAQEVPEIADVEIMKHILKVTKNA
jgi:hypothetical protein